MNLRTAGLLCLVTFGLATTLSGCAGSSNTSPNRIQRMMLEPARDAETRGDLESAFREYERAALSGVPLAQFRLARMYEQGRGTPVDDEQAARWYEAAAESGYGPAQAAIARTYEQGRGVPQDFAAALAWYRRAAESDPKQYNQVGNLVLQGRGVPADPVAAAEHFRIAAEAANPDAQFALAELYRKGEGVPADPAAAERWYKTAAAEYERAIQSGDARAHDRLGQMYLDGRGVAKNAQRGVALLEVAAQQGRESAQWRLARVLEQGDDGLPPDPARAAAHYNKLAESGKPAALYSLAGFYAAGNGVGQNGYHAAELYKQAAEQGEVRAYRKLGELYAEGKAVRQDQAEANKWFLLAARNGDNAAAFKLGDAYERGNGVPADPVQAVGWYQIARTLGHERAAERLEQIASQLEPAQIQQAGEIVAAWERERAPR